MRQPASARAARPWRSCGLQPDPSPRFDVLITDLMMPNMDGIALLRQALEMDSDLVSIVMTGHGTIDTAVEAMQAGALDYILKPFNLSVITPVLSRALAVRDLRRQNAELVRQVERNAAELEVKNRELQAFTHTVSHDLRQPLNGVIGFAELLLSEKPGALNPTQKEYLGDIYNGGHQLLRLTADLLQFSRLGQQAAREGAHPHDRAGVGNCELAAGRRAVSLHRASRG